MCPRSALSRLHSRCVPGMQDQIVKFFETMSPHLRQLGFRVVSLAGAQCVAMLPYSEDLIGDPVNRVLHGGVVTSLLDTTGGLAALSAVGTPIPIATLDLRIDYLRPARAGRDIYARVDCYRTTHNVAFARGIAYDVDASDPVAAMAATYMLRTQTVRRSTPP